MSRYRILKDNRDANEPEIIAELEAVGARAFRIKSTWDEGVPDLLIAYKGLWTVVEVKQEGKGLEPDQAKFRDMCSKENLPWFLLDHIDDVKNLIDYIERETS